MYYEINPYTVLKYSTFYRNNAWKTSHFAKDGTVPFGQD